ncbi:MAG: ATP-binding protein [Phycisphaerae bacterium]
MFHRSISIKSALLLLILVVVLPSLMVQCGIYYYWFHTNRQHEIQSNKELARSMGSTFDAYIQDLANHEETLAAVLAGKEYTLDEMNALFRASARDYPALNAFVFCSLEGRVVACSDPNVIGIDVRDRDYYQRALRGREAVLSDLLEGRADPNPIFIVAMALYKGDRVTGVLAASVNPDRLGEATLKVERSRGSDISFFDRRGRLVYHSPSRPLTWKDRSGGETSGLLEQALAGREAEGIFHSPADGQDRIGARVPIGKLGWVAGASEPRQVIMGPLWWTMMRTGGLNVAVVLGSLLVAWIIGWLIARGLMQLRAYALVVGKGHLDQVAPLGMISEIKDLAAGFNEMVLLRKRAEETLRQSQQRLQLAQEAGGIGTFDLDLRTNRLTWTGELEAIYGYASGQFGGTFAHWKQHLHPEDAEEACFSVEEAVRTRSDMHAEFRIVWPDGSMHWIAAWGRVICEGGEPTRMIGVNMDVTARKNGEEAIRQSEERFRKIFESNMIGIVFWDQAGRLIEANHAFCDLIGYSSEEICDGLVHWKDLTSEAQAARDDQGNEELSTWGVCEPYEKELIHRDGRPVPVMIGAAVLGDMEQERVSFALDISDRKRAEEALREATEKLAGSNQDLEQFAYVASHDLQEPLRMISGHLQIVRDRLADSLDETCNESLHFAVDGAQRMQALIHDLLAYARIGTQPKPLEPIDVNTIVARAMQALASSIRDEGATVDVAVMPTVWADSLQLTQLFQNLLSNAIKYHRDGSGCHVQVGSRRESLQWVFWVKDDGIGIKSEFFDRIFQVFQRLHTRGQYSGTGIGLAICKKIVERHGGRIWVESREGQGTTFFFTIPAHETTQADGWPGPERSVA